MELQTASITVYEKQKNGDVSWRGLWDQRDFDNMGEMSAYL